MKHIETITREHKTKLNYLKGFAISSEVIAVVSIASGIYIENPHLKGVGMGIGVCTLGNVFAKLIENESYNELIANYHEISELNSRYAVTSELSDK